MLSIGKRYQVTGYNRETGLDDTIDRVVHLYEAANLCMDNAGKFQYCQVIDMMAPDGAVSIWNCTPDGHLVAAHVKHEPGPEPVEIELPEESKSDLDERLADYVTRLRDR